MGIRTSTRITTVALLVLLTATVSSAARALFPTGDNGAAKALYQTGGYGGSANGLGAFPEGIYRGGYGGLPDGFQGSEDFRVGFGVRYDGINDQVASKRDVPPTTTATTETQTDKAAASKNKDGTKHNEGSFDVGDKDKNKIEQKGTGNKGETPTEGGSASSPKSVLFPSSGGFEGGYGGFPGGYGGFPGSYSGFGCGYGCVKYEGPTKEGDKIHATGNKGETTTQGGSASSPKSLLFPDGGSFEGGYGGFPGSYSGFGCGYGCVKYEGPIKEADKIYGATPP